MTGKEASHAVIVALFLALTAHAQLPLRVAEFGRLRAQQFGGALANAGDVDGDGIGDIFVGSPGYKTSTVTSAQGAVEALSGADGSLIWRRVGPVAGESLGVALASGFDLNRDGVNDVIAGAPFADPVTQNEGRVYLLDGASGLILRVYDGWNQGALLGSALEVIGDVDDDGFDDFVFGAYFASRFIGAEGYVEVVSSRVWTLIRRHWGANVFDNLGESLERIPDLDGDLVDDYAVGIPGWDGKGVNRGAVNVYSAKTGTRIHRIVGKKDVAGFAKSIALHSLPEGPHQHRLLIGAALSPVAGPFSGHVEVFSMDDASYLFQMNGSGSVRRFGEKVSPAGDVDGDGFQDFLIAATADPTGGPYAGAVHVFSGQSYNEISFFPGVTGSSLGRSLCAMGDINGDGFDEFAMGSAFPGSTFLEGSVAIASIVGVARRDDPLATHGLQWIPGIQDAAEGALIATATPGTVLTTFFAFKNPGIVGPLYIDPAAVITRDTFTMAPLGQKEYRLNLRVPAIAGTVITAQMVSASMLADYSPAIDLLFGP